MTIKQLRERENTMTNNDFEVGQKVVPTPEPKVKPVVEETPTDEPIVEEAVAEEPTPEPKARTKRKND